MPVLRRAAGSPGASGSGKRSGRAVRSALTSKPSLTGASVSGKRAQFRQRLLRWYAANQRRLPWRESHDPYRIWLSEIMLQQTRVAAVLEHYAEFLRRFPSVQRLASAKEQSVLSAWSGLGYYRRAHMLHAAAKTIVERHRGCCPGTAAQLQRQPGRGRYPAAAIASIAFGEPVAVVDGNVERVLQRCVGRTLNENETWAQAGELLNHKRPGDFNQAMMELGATVCTPRQPRCTVCPVATFCATQGEGKRKKRTERPVRAKISCVLNRRNGAVFLRQRSESASQMPGLWELPECTGMHKGSAVLFTLRHSITITSYTVRVWTHAKMEDASGEWVPTARLDRMALTGLTRKILRKAGLMNSR